MKIQSITGFAVMGLSLRTQNSDEMDPKTARIGSLWQAFYEHVFPALEPNSSVYGVYTHYESDVNGFFDVIACSDGINQDQSPLSDSTLTESTSMEWVQTQVGSGNYAVFSAQGEMPGAVIEAWQQVWQYFNSPDCEFTRAYETDFEHYVSESQVDVYIGIK